MHPNNKHLNMYIGSIYCCKCTCDLKEADTLASIRHHPPVTLGIVERLQWTEKRPIQWLQPVGSVRRQADQHDAMVSSEGDRIQCFVARMPVKEEQNLMDI